MKTCPICKKDKTSTEFYKNNTRVDNLSCWCKECVRAKYPPKYHRDRIYTVEARYNALRLSAKKREIPLLLSLEEYRVLTQEGSAPCDYCGEPIIQTGHGLDRKDFFKGYELGNVVPCCKLCNQIKAMLERKKPTKDVPAMVPAIAKKMRQRVENSETPSE